MSEFNHDAESPFSGLSVAEEDAFTSSPLKPPEDERWVIAARPPADGEVADVEEHRDSLKLRYREERSSLKTLALAAGREALEAVAWREGSRGQLCSRFLALRVRPANVKLRRAAAAEELPLAWLVCEWPDGEAEPSKHRLSNLPVDTPLERCVSPRNCAAGRARLLRAHRPPDGLNPLGRTPHVSGVRPAGAARFMYVHLALSPGPTPRCVAPALEIALAPDRTTDAVATAPRIALLADAEWMRMKNAPLCARSPTRTRSS